MLRIVVVGHGLVEEANRGRWQQLAIRHAVEVVLLLPHFWQNRKFGNLNTWRPRAEERDRFRVLPIQVSSTSDWHRYLFVSLDAHLRALQPDAIFVMQGELSYMTQQLILYRRVWAPRAKLFIFSWNNNVDLGQVKLKTRLAWRNVCQAADAAVAGNCEVMQGLRARGFEKPIIVQNEFGLDPERFRPCAEIRARVRSELGLHGFVIGFAARLVPEKGIMDLVSAVLELPDEWTLLIVGDGVLRERIGERFADHPSAERLHLVGQQPPSRLADYFQSMDVLVSPSRTVPSWKEQFGQVLLYAMACGVPVIGSSSGAIPEVLDDAGLIFPEGDVASLREGLRRLMQDQALRESFVQRGYKRVERYSSAAIADETYEFVSALQADRPG